MPRIFAIALFAVIFSGPLSAEVATRAPVLAEQSPSSKQVLTDAAVVAAIIAASIAAYRSGGPGPCACPEDRDRVDHRCGKRSAHSRAGGWTVYCYASDVSKEMIDAYRKSHGD